MIPRTHIFAVAIEEHQDSSFPTIAYAEQDAAGFLAAWQGLGVDPSDCRTLVSDEATGTAFLSALSDFLIRVGAEDRILFFFCGHVCDLGGSPVLVCFDSQCDALENASVPLEQVLDAIRNTKCAQTLLFLDATRGSLLGKAFSTDEVRDFCKESPTRFAFVSSKPNEVSHPSGTLTQGIWTHCLIQSLKGMAKPSLDKHHRVTTATLQSYLEAEVPRILRVTVAGSKKQTPIVFGSKSKELILADYSERLQQRQLAQGAMANPIKDSFLTGEVRGRVRDLRGYTKPKTTLSTHTDWERDFVEKAGAAEVTSLATEIFEQLREAFRYKRKDLSFTNIASTASIKGPDFDVNIALSQDPQDAERYLLSTEVRSFRNSEVINDPNFLAIFTQYCRRIEFELEADMDLESKIDDIEEIDALADHLDYNPECTEFTLKLPQAGINIYATGSRMIFSLDAPGDLKLLLGNAQKAFTQLSGNRINLGLRSND